MIILGFFIVAMLMFMGVKQETVVKTVSSGTVVWTVVIVSLILFIISVTTAFQDVKSPYEDEEDKTRTTEGLNALVHPRLLGALFLLIIATYAIMFISQGFAKG